ncbi:type VII toxin-antitoxin system MntA family adenylyltransferase antitoxin [Kushneria aurantia]|uniref:Nucleotidyltransferase domain-containing protein n=1 Tax=Kushneria aurantia TaxID=504092 RepID=A0ABV6G5A5_9GAMM|nr:nucleotidyltransferase domain-containing protein [Kushneria aurantia]
MSDSLLRQRSLALLQQALGERLLALYAFGSRVSNEAGPHSDLDLAVLLDERADPFRLWEAGQQLAVALDLDVDLIDLNEASTVMQARVITSGECWWSRDDSRTLQFEVFVIREKLALDEARAPLLADIRREGRVYGR